MYGAAGLGSWIPVDTKSRAIGWAGSRQVRESSPGRTEAPLESIEKDSIKPLQGLTEGAAHRPCCMGAGALLFAEFLSVHTYCAKLAAASSSAGHRA